MNKYFLNLGISNIIDAIRKYIRTEKGNERLDKIRFLSNYNEFLKERNIVKELYSSLYKYGDLPITFSKSLDPILNYALKGGCIDIEGFKSIYYDILIQSSINDFKTNNNIREFNSLYAILNSLKDLVAVKNLILSVFNEEFLVKDSASNDLRSIRKELKKIENSIKSLILREIEKNSSMLNDTTYYYRNNTYLLPVKTTYKARIKGIVHDVSDSGETTFIEPESILSANNSLLSLKAKEKKEIYKILSMLSLKVASYSNIILENNYIIGYLDYLNAISLYSKSIDGNYIQTIDEPIFDIKDAAHPLIDIKVVVRNSLKMNRDDFTLIISGSNAGGKSVYLKMVGLLVILNQMNIALPMKEDSLMGFYHHVYIDIGDFQSIQENLSTFSAHILNTKNIINAASNRDLVLIDELGTGTDPNEGEALSIAVAEYLLNKKVKSIITSHFEGLKRYALTTHNVLCGSLMFDEESLNPKYRVAFGVPGKSYGLIIANKYGINKEIINRANDILNQKINKDKEDILEVLTSKINQNEEMLRENIKLKDELNRSIVEFKNKEKIYDTKINKINKETSVIKEEVIKETLQYIEELKKKMLKNPDLKLNHLIELKKEVEDLLEEDTIEIAEEEKVFNLGDYVYSSELEVYGKVIKIKKDEIKIITSGKLTYTLNKSQLEKKLEPKVKKIKEKTIDSFILTKPLRYEINLVGLRVDEAMLKLDSYFDIAYTKSNVTLKIIHGFGTGALRNAVHTYLKNNTHVKDYHLGGQFDGGMGVTICELK